MKKVLYFTFGELASSVRAMLPAVMGTGEISNVDLVKVLAKVADFQ